MDFVGYECKLLYKQSLESWLKDKNRTRKFSVKDLDFVRVLQQKYIYKYDEDQGWVSHEDGFYLDGRFGYSFFSEPDDFVLFSFNEFDGTKTLYNLRLEKPESGEEKNTQNDGEKKDITDDGKANTRSYKKIYLHNLIRGSEYGRHILAYSAKGHVFLIDLDAKSGVLVGEWPIDPKLLSSGNCCQLLPYDPEIKAAVSGEFSLVAVTGPSEEHNENKTELPIRVFNLNNKQCCLKTLQLNPGLNGASICMMSFNPYNPNLLYISLNVSKSQYCNYKLGSESASRSCDDSSVDDDDNDEHLVLVLFDISTQQVLSEVSGVSLIPFNYFYESVESVKFLKQGRMLMIYKFIPINMIVIIDAFSLEILGNVNLSGLETVLGCHTLISECESQFAIFKDQDRTVANKLIYDVEVFKIPDNDFSLKNVCRKAIIERVDRKKIESLNLPDMLKKYLKL